MSLSINALHTAQRALQAHEQAFERAAGQVARFGLESAEAGGAPTSQPASSAEGSVDLADSEVAMLIAQRSFSAALRVMRASNDMLKEAVRLGDV